MRAKTKFNLRSLRRISEQYTTKTYQHAACKACKRVDVPPWGPSRLRHNAAIFLREQFGIEVARVILGKTSAAMTEVYAEMAGHRSVGTPIKSRTANKGKSAETLTKQSFQA